MFDLKIFREFNEKKNYYEIIYIYNHVCAYKIDYLLFSYSKRNIIARWGIPSQLNIASFRISTSLNKVRKALI